MNERIDRHLDGELPPEDLSVEETRDAATIARELETVVAHYRDYAAPDLTSRIVAALPVDLHVAPTPVHGGGSGAWLWRRRRITVTYRPAVAFGILAAAILAFVMLPFGQTPSEPPLANAVFSQLQMYVQFRLEAPSASDVRLAGSFTGWEPTVELSETAPGIWSAMIPLQPGVHDYTFLVDGDEWVVDPNAPNVEDSFGGLNSRLFLAAPFGSA